MNIFSISAGAEPHTLHVEIAAATQITFDVNFDGLDYQRVIEDICTIAPHMMNRDADLAEAYDNAFRTQPKMDDRIAVQRFLKQYAGRVPDTLRTEFDL